jgi:hypothetical protein
VATGVVDEMREMVRRDADHRTTSSSAPGASGLVFADTKIAEAEADIRLVELTLAQGINADSLQAKRFSPRSVP